MSQFTKNNIIFSIPVINEGVKETYEPFLTAIIFSFFINLLMFVSPLYMLQIYDRVVGSRSITTLIAITLLVLGIGTAVDDFSIEDLSFELYNSKLDAIKDNFDRGFNLLLPEDYIYINFIKK
jgi:hypothetical protein